MQYKIASLILNAGKNPNTINRVFVAQPEPLKEALAGRLFILAEIEGRRQESEKILAFLVNTINSDYYGDEKILLRQKIETIKVENIFEAVLTKTNKSLVDFINEEKIKISQYSANLTVGVIFENKLYFSNLGKNKALLIYPKRGQYAISNVESSGEDEPQPKKSGPAADPKFFSSVVSGDIPEDAYFVFANETLPEYLSTKELIDVITKLPPIVAAEQIKNTLAQINTYVPFLAIIIKNSYGVDNLETETYEANVSAHSSISQLNYTEEKTEKMLAPAGLINLKKIGRGFSRIISGFKSEKPTAAPIQPSLQASRKELNEEMRVITPPVSLRGGKRHKRHPLQIKDAIFFRRKSFFVLPRLKNFFHNFLLLFSGELFISLIKNLKTWFGALNKSRRGLMLVLGLCALVLVASIIYSNFHKRSQVRQERFDNISRQIEEASSQVDSYLLYNNESGARAVLIGLEGVINSLPQDNKKEKNDFNTLSENLKTVAAKVQRLTKTGVGDSILELSSISQNAQADNLILAGGALYVADNNSHSVYRFNLKDGAKTTITVGGSTNLSRPKADDSFIYYLDETRIVKVNVKAGSAQIFKLDSNNSQINDYYFYNSNLYVLSSPSNQINRFTLKGDIYSSPTAWLKENLDLKSASAITINGPIYVLSTNGQVNKLFKGKKQDFDETPIIPAFSSADKLISGAKYLYIFEKSSRRLAVLDQKDGKFIGQFDLSAIGEIKDIALDENTKELYALRGGTVVKLKLNY